MRWIPLGLVLLMLPAHAAYYEAFPLIGVVQDDATFVDLGADPPPTVQQGIGPGSALRMGVDGAQYICTASFLLRDPQTYTYYLSTAGHCLVRDNGDPAPVTGRTHPEKTFNHVYVCVTNCINNGLGMGTFVRLVAEGDYHPVAYAVSGGVGSDFGLIELPAAAHPYLRPEMPQWGGPESVAQTPRVGDLLAHYGHGTLLVPGVAGVVTRTPLDQGRLAALSYTAGGAFEALGHVTGGDSGSGASLARATAPGMAEGTQALGVITHGVVVVGAPVMAGTTLRHGMDLAMAHLEIPLALVPEGDALPQGPPATARLSIDAPRSGERLAAGVEVRIRGTAGQGDGPLPTGAKVEVAVDDASFATGRVEAEGTAEWSAPWEDPRPGLRTVWARVVAADGAVLAQDNVTVHVEQTATATQTSSQSSTQTSSQSSTQTSSPSSTQTSSPSSTQTSGASTPTATSSGTAQDRIDSSPRDRTVDERAPLAPLGWLPVVCLLAAAVRRW